MRTRAGGNLSLCWSRHVICVYVRCTCKCSSSSKLPYRRVCMSGLYVRLSSTRFIQELRVHSILSTVKPHSPPPYKRQVLPPHSVMVWIYRNFPPSRRNSWLSAAFIMCSHTQRMLTDPYVWSMTYLLREFGAWL